jgi:hypothetical protein
MITDIQEGIANYIPSKGLQVRSKVEAGGERCPRLNDNESHKNYDTTSTCISGQFGLVKIYQCKKHHDLSFHWS